METMNFLITSKSLDILKQQKIENKYEALIDDYHGHSYHDKFTAASDEEAIKIAKEKGYGHFCNNDGLWRVTGEYADYSHFDAAEQEKRNRNYRELKVW